MTMQTQEPVKSSASRQETSAFPVISGINPAAERQFAQPLTAQTELERLAKADPALAKEASAYAKKLVQVGQTDVRGQRDRRKSLEQMGAEDAKRFAVKSKMLVQPIAALKDSVEGGEVATSLLALRNKVEELDPYKYRFGPGWFGRMIGRAPIIGARVRAYLDRFLSAQTVLDTIQKSLANGQERLVRDNDSMADDQIEYRELQEKMKGLIRKGQLLDASLVEEANAVGAGTDEYKFITEELIWTLRRQVLAWQRLLATGQKAEAAYEVLIRTNRELIRVVDTTRQVTMTELSAAVAIAIGLKNQKAVLDMIDGTVAVTEEIARKSSEDLKTQGVEVFKRSASVGGDIEQLKQNFANVKEALENISTFKQEYLPQMAEQILQFNEITTEADKLLEQMRKGNAADIKIK